MTCRARAISGSPDDLAKAAALQVGDRVRFKFESQARFKVRLRSDRYIILTKPFNARRTVLYTVIDLEQGIRGPDDSWGTGYESPEEIAEALQKLEEGAAALSMRRSVRLEIADVKPAPPSSSATTQPERSLHG